MNVLRRFITISLLAISSTAFASSDNDLDELQGRMGNEWVLVKNDRLHQIKTWIKQEDNKRTRSFKIEAIINGKIEDYVRMALDIDDTKRWYYEVIESKLLKKISATEYLLYMVHNAPPGSPDRDVILQITYVPQTANKPSLEIKAVSLPNYLPSKPPLVRMEAENYITTLTPLGKNQYKQETEGYIDPGGHDPAWVINFIQRIAPYNTQVSIYRRLQQNNMVEKAPLPFPIYEAEHYQ